jgi:hypothetical protein
MSYQKASNSYNNSKYKRYTINKVKVQEATSNFVSTYQLKAPFTYLNIEPIDDDFEVTIRAADNLVYAALFDKNYKLILYRQIIDYH